MANNILRLPAVMAGIDLSRSSIYLRISEGKNKHASKKQRLGRGAVGKTAVLGMREKGGRVKAKPLSRVDGVTLHESVHENIEGGSEIHTDEHLGYQGLGYYYMHETVNHAAGEFSRDGVSTNGMESVWAVMKRGLHGVYPIS